MAMGSSLRVVDGRKKAPHVCVYDPYLMEYLKNSGDMEYLRRLVPQLEGHSTPTIVFASSRFPLYMSWVYRVTRFTNAVVSLVTANAYISTLGGGYFLCRHLNQAKLMAQLQICVSQGLQDPILTSKCRINLAYGAMAQGKFKRAQRIITDETKRAHILRSEEMHSVCHAAQVYLDKTWDLHQSILVHEPTDTTRVVDEYYRQRVVRKSR
ncbi:hypothetical protein H310_14065 [Aphanomyces invadans]|uniref:Uncharacterized protein n=1 Tax=Aphanomyces invadans TaxID=157072 RepID=A0A024TBA3_9STRA|nr:hypothetical protein H310_14065 [Aphanomyces invadans]ETV91395.1 hypothetical protein H310_14065 [Aphanomyces invadans]|eukprot:XP_008880023.1 hypothetical protein H310_14065 [Aphanomyces invadans]